MLVVDSGLRHAEPESALLIDADVVDQKLLRERRLCIRCSDKVATDRQVQEQMKREKKYAKEQKFYQGSDYNLSAFQIDEDSLPDVPALEPDYDFDMSSGVYTD